MNDFALRNIQQAHLEVIANCLLILLFVLFLRVRDASASVGEGLAPMELDLMGVALECVSVKPPPALLMKAKYCSLSLQTPFAERMNTLVRT